MNKITKQSQNTHEDLIEKLKQLYPPLFDDEGNLDEKELKSLMSGFASTTSGKYEFNWAGKMASKRTAFTTSKGALIPDKSRSVDFGTTKNLIIEGDNLEVLKLLQKAYFNKIKVIYIDPPYNTGKDFVYSDNFTQDKKAYWEESGTVEDGVKMDTNTESQGRYHSNWLNMMYPRLLLARNLLKDDGVIFVSIDDNEVHNLRKVMDEVFGEENFVGDFIWKSKHGGGGDSPYLVQENEYILFYSKSIDSLAPLFSTPHPDYEKMFRYEDERGRYYLERLDKKGIDANRPNLIYPIEMPDKSIKDISPAIWRLSKEEFERRKNLNQTEFKKDRKGEWQVYTKTYLIDDNGKSRRVKARSILKQSIVGFTQDGNKEMREIMGKSLFDNPKPTRLVKYLLDIILNDDPNGIALDFFAGSGTTGHAVMDLNKEDGGNRKFILVQLPEATDEKSEAKKAGFNTIADICIERVKRVGERIVNDELLMVNGNKKVVNDELSMGNGNKKMVNDELSMGNGNKKMVNDELSIVNGDESGKEENSQFTIHNSQLDTGFKVFRLAKSYFPENLFSPDPEKTEAENIAAFEDYLEKAQQQLSFQFEEEELMYEILSKDGFELKFTKEKVAEFDKNNVYRIQDGEKEALICLDNSLAEETVELLSRSGFETQPYRETRFICLERAVDTTKKWNLKNVMGQNLWVV